METFQRQDSTFYDHLDESDLEELVRQRFLNHPAETERLEQLLSLVPDDADSLLDVGTGYGIFLHELGKNRSLRLEGCDLSERRLSWGRARGLSLKVSSAHELPYPDRAFSVVACCEVLEHLQWGVYEKALSELQRVARDYILISVPYDERRNFVTCPYCSASANPYYHHRSFTVRDMASLFSEFRLLETRAICTVSLLTTLKPYLPAPWPSDMICPSCLYRDERPATKVRDRRLNRFKAFLRGITIGSRPRWLAALFKRPEV